MQKRVIHTDKVPPARVPLSQGIRAGDWVFASGQLGLDPRTGQLAEGGIRAQTRQVLENLAAVLEAGGSSLPDLAVPAGGAVPARPGLERERRARSAGPAEDRRRALRRDPGRRHGSGREGRRARGQGAEVPAAVRGGHAPRPCLPRLAGLAAVRRARDGAGGMTGPLGVTGANGAVGRAILRAAARPGTAPLAVRALVRSARAAGAGRPHLGPAGSVYGGTRSL